MQQPRPERELDEFSLALARRGDDAACRRLVETYERAVFALLSRLLVARGQRALVEDLAQETFLRVFRALPAFTSDGRAQLSTWILTIATRLALDELARRRPEVEPLERVLDHASETPASRIDGERIRRAITRALEALPPEQRAVFVLREHHELSYEELSRSLEVDLNTIKSRLFRARMALRAALSEVHRAL
jgi:RNA polymerase sigma-70 factor (ECF subfamily)